MLERLFVKRNKSQTDLPSQNMCYNYVQLLPIIYIKAELNKIVFIHLKKKKETC